MQRRQITEHFLNLEDAFAAWETDPGPREWRDALPRAGLPRRPRRRSARRAFALEAGAARCTSSTPLSPQLEIETYTWDVLPDHLKTGDIVEYVCREIEWVRGELVPAREEPELAGTR